MHLESSKTKSALALTISALICFADACASSHQASAANACKSSTACNEMRQAKRYY
jgi:hypothetical protein